MYSGGERRSLGEGKRAAKEPQEGKNLQPIAHFMIFSSILWEMSLSIESDRIKSPSKPHEKASGWER
jgi:hypothetical protein